MANVFDLEAVLKLNDSGFKQGVENAGKAGATLGSKLKGALGTAAKAGGIALAAVGTAAAGATKYILDGAAATASYGDNIDKMSQKLGMSSTAYQEWDAVLQHSGASIESMQSSMKQLQVAAENNSAAFEALGISQEQLTASSPEQLFNDTITALQNVTSETERTALASKLLGRGATELGPLLNMSAEETQNLKDRVHELGGVMSEDAVKASARYADSLQDMKTAFSGLQRGLFLEFLPGITTVMDGLTAIFSGDTEGGLGMINEGINDVVTGISEKLPEFIELGMGILSALTTAIIDNLPMLISAGLDLILQLIIGILNAIPQLVEAAPQIIAALVSGLKAAWPQLKAAGTQLIQMVGQGLSAAWGWLSGKASEVWNGIKASVAASWEETKGRAAEIWDSVKSTISGAWDAIKSSVSAATSAVGSTVSSAFSNVASTVSSIWDGIKSTISNVMEGIKEKIRSAIDTVKSIVNFTWSLPKLKLPRFSISGGFSLNPPSVPTFSVTWNRKALNEPFMFHDATLFGAGEAGDEVLYGKSRLMEDIKSASAESNSALLARVDAILSVVEQHLPEATRRPIVLDSGALVGYTAVGMDDALGDVSVLRGRGLCLA